MDKPTKFVLTFLMGVLAKWTCIEVITDTHRALGEHELSKKLTKDFTKQYSLSSKSSH